MNYQAEHLEGAVRSAQRARVPLLLVELPLHPLLGELLPPGTIARFRRYLRHVASRDNVSFVTLGDLGVSFEANDFLDSSHMNGRGAEKYTTAIAPHVAKAFQATPGRKERRRTDAARPR
jgi:hypothetical protein